MGWIRAKKAQQVAHSILIIGGGPVGVELAGEIAVDFPDKNITLVHSGSRLMEFIGPKASEKTLDWLRRKGVDVKLEQLVNLNSLPDGMYTTSCRETIKADCHFLCTGKPLASSWLKETFLKANLDLFGRLTVDQCMRVKGHDNIFAVGDITDIREMKQGFLAQKHATVAAKNWKLLMDGGKEGKMAEYEPRSVKAVVSLGRREAVAQFSLTTVIGSIPGTIKSKDLFVGKTRKLMGLKPDIMY